MRVAAGRTAWQKLIRAPAGCFRYQKSAVSRARLVTGFWIQAEMFSDSFSGRVQVPTS
jgi:hypothetical protein